MPPPRWCFSRHEEQGILAAFIENQQGRVLEGEHGEGRHEGVPEGNVRLAGTRVGDAVKTVAEQSEEGIGGQSLACLPGGETHGWQFLLPKSEDREAREVFCTLGLRKERPKPISCHRENDWPGIAGNPG